MVAATLQRQQVLCLGPVFLSFLNRHARWTLWPQGMVLMRSFSWICLLQRPQRSKVGVFCLFLTKLGLMPWFDGSFGFANMTFGLGKSRWSMVRFFPIYEEIGAVSSSFLLTFVISWRGNFSFTSISSRSKVKSMLSLKSSEDFSKPSFCSSSYFGTIESSFSLSCSLTPPKLA